MAPSLSEKTGVERPCSVGSVAVKFDDNLLPSRERRRVTNAIGSELHLMSEMRQERPKLSLAVQCSRRMRGIRNKLGRSPNTVPQAIAVHRRAHDRRAKLQRLSQSFWWPIRFALRALTLRRERSALDRLIKVDPDTTDEAREKTLYFMALMIVGSDRLDRAQVKSAEASLRRYRNELKDLLVARK